MKNIKSIKILALTIFLMGMGSACSERDFLNVDPQGQKKSEDFFVTPTHALEAVNAIYGNLKSWDISGFSHIALTSIASDQAIKGSVPGDAGFMDDIDMFTFTPSHGMLNGYWTGQYQGVNLCNQALDNIPNIGMDESLKSRLLAESKFVRAFHYFNLVRAFGGVPLLTRVPVDPIELNPPRASKEEVYAQIEKDLTEAASVLPLTYDTDNKGRATKGAALTMLAKVALYQEKYQEAMTYAEQVMGMSYTLVDDFNGMFRVEGELNQESIFEIAAGVYTQDCGSYCQLAEIQAPRSQFGWGFNEPTAELENSFEDGDIRMEATILKRGETTPEGDVIKSTVPNERANQKMYVPTSVPNPCGYGYGRMQNRRVLRYAEVLLIYAEAANELGMKEKALENMNLVRERADLEPLESSLDQAALRKAIWHEKAMELAMEDDRFFELVRTGEAGSVLRAQGKKFVDGKHEVFAIPQVQIDLSGGKLMQNPGY